MRDILFLLPIDFDDDGQPWYCRECIEVRGLLACYPAIAGRLDIRTVDYPRPRAAMVALLGPDQQGCPRLVIADDGWTAPAHLAITTGNGRRIVEGADAIGEYLAAAYGMPRPHR